MTTFRKVGLLLSIVAACEYRDQASALTIEESCYVLVRPQSIVVRAQALSGSEGVDGVTVRWGIAPALLTLDPPLTVTGPTKFGTISSHGVVETTIGVPASLGAEQKTATITASAAVSNDLFVATAEVRIGSAEEMVGCPQASELDAGTDTAAMDAGIDVQAVDAGIDASALIAPSGN
jgi:hypothetical protein